MSDFRAGRLAAMRAKIAAIETGGRADSGVLPFGDPRIDDCLPGGGLPLGRWHEIVGPGMEVETAAAPAAFTALLAAPLARLGETVWVLRRDDLNAPYEEEARELLHDPWQARNDYVDVILDRSPRCIDEFLARHAKRELTHDEQVRALKLMEMQRHLLLMYTSCGWFFDELSGIETVQVIQYAGRAVQLATELFDLQPSGSSDRQITR